MNVFPLLLTAILLSNVINICVHAGGTVNDLIRLRDSIFSNYTKEFRPVFYLDDYVNVYLSLLLFSILDLNEVTGIVTLSTSLSVRWTDYRLAWNASEHGGISWFMYNSSDIWKPKIYIATSADSIDLFRTETFDVKINENGGMEMNLGKVIRSTCELDMTRFPVDSQTCTVMMLPWDHDSHRIRLLSLYSDIYISFYTPNGEWDLRSTSVTNVTKYGTNVPGLDFNIHLNRRSTYLTISMIIPMFLLCFLNPFVFLLPATSGERMSYIVTMFLSLAVYMTLVGENIPKVSDHVAGISYFLLIAMLCSCLLIILTIITLRCEAINDLNKFPKWLLRLVSLTKYNDSGNRNRIQDHCDASKPDIDQTNEIVQENPIISVDKDDVMNFIDKTLFFTSFLIATVIVSVFIGKNW